MLLCVQVGNYVHNMATCIAGFAVGFVNCWQIALLTLGTAPLIVAAGGLSNLFLNRLAEMVQEAYAEAAAIAEQVCILPDYLGTNTVNLVCSLSTYACIEKPVRL